MEEEDRGTRGTVAFGRDVPVPVPAAVSPASASARERSKVMRRRRWRDAAVVGAL